MSGLQHPPCLQRQTVIVRGVELEATIWHICDVPSTCPIVHANLRDPLVAFRRTYDTDDFPRSPMVIFRLGLLLFGPVCLGLDYQQIIGPKSVSCVEGASKSAGGSRRKQGKGDDVIGRFWALRRNYLV